MKNPIPDTDEAPEDMEIVPIHWIRIPLTPLEATSKHGVDLNDTVYKRPGHALLNASPVRALALAVCPDFEPTERPLPPHPTNWDYDTHEGSLYVRLEDSTPPLVRAVRLGNLEIVKPSYSTSQTKM
ncbi:hypothetical protein BDV12DRAFT_203616 [Aspergillus spectabilis]